MKIIKPNWSYGLVFAYIFLVIVYTYIQGSNIWFQIHDNLDSNMAYFKMLKDNNIFFESNASVPFLGGSVQAGGLVSPYKIATLVYAFFDPYIALIINHIFSVVIAVLGSTLLGKEILDDSWKDYKNLIVIVAFCFGILPVFPTTEVSAASLPLLFWMLYRLYMKNDRKMYLGIFLYPTLSSFALFEIFICGYLLLFFLISSFIKKTISTNILLALLVFIGGMVVFDWNTFYTFLFSGVPSIRGDRTIEPNSFLACMKEALYVFIFGHYHSASSHTLVVLPVCTAYLIIKIVKSIKNRTPIKLLNDPFTWLYSWCIFNAFIYGISEWSDFQIFLSVYMPPLSGFSFARTLWFNGFIWYFMFAIVLIRFMKQNLLKRARFTYFLAIIATICVVLTPQTYNHIQMQIKNIYLNSTGQTTDMSYNEFYSSGLFEKIKKEIDYQGEWSIAVGMHPAILEYNKIATLDGYLSSYPKYYKDQFRELIQPEFDQNTKDEQYFNTFGGRAYIFNTEISYNPTKIPQNSPITLRIDPSAFKKMNGTYIFSRAEISNYDDLGFSRIDSFTDNLSPYTIYVYKIK